MKIRLYDTYTRSIRPFEPLEGNTVRMYACGPTVYDYAHVGNLRTYVFEDILRRVLEFGGYDVRHAMNITDVGHLVSDADTGEDKMEKGSRRTGKTAWEIAAIYTDAFKEDIDRLNILKPTVWCRATEHIPEQIAAILKIEEAGFTYRTSDGIYFDTARLPDYGYLARLKRDGLQAGARVDLGEKCHTTDFALWKFSPADAQRQMEWESPWGKGFPGWHIECSAMSTKYLGSLFDIHCGGEDHINVHHPNEIAQAQICYGTRLANFWMHGTFLKTGQAKMSKSSGEFLRMQTLIDGGYDPLTFRYLCLTAHYRRDLNFTWEGMDAAATALNRLRRLTGSWSSVGMPDPDWVDRFSSEICDDLNMPRALAVIWDLARSDLPAGVKRATVLHLDSVLGLRLGDDKRVAVPVPEEVADMVSARERARKQKDWKRADRLRDRINALGYDIEDTDDGPRLRSRE